MCTLARERERKRAKEEWVLSIRWGVLIGKRKYKLKNVVYIDIDYYIQ